MRAQMIVSRLSRVVVLGMMAACSGGGGGNQDAGVDLRAGSQCPADGQSFALAGRYGVQAALTVNVKVVAGCVGASCLVDSDADAKLLLLCDVTQNGTSATVTARPCRITIPPVSLAGAGKPVQLVAPDALVAALPPVMSSSTLSGGTTCAHFDTQPITIVLGANLASPSDALPKGTTPTLCGGAASTACVPAPGQTGCVCDQEGDGALGASLQAMNTPGYTDIDKLYVDLRTSVTLAGQIWPAATGQATPGPRIIGNVNDLKMEQNVLGCHRTAAPMPTPVRDCDATEAGTVGGFNPSVSQSVNTASTFVAVPMAAAASCADLIANEAALFP